MQNVSKHHGRGAEYVRECKQRKHSISQPANALGVFRISKVKLVSISIFPHVFSCNSQFHSLSLICAALIHVRSTMNSPKRKLWASQWCVCLRFLTASTNGSLVKCLIAYAVRHSLTCCACLEGECLLCCCWGSCRAHKESQPTIQVWCLAVALQL